MTQLAVMPSEAETRRPHTSGEHLFQRILAAVDAGRVVANQRTFDKGDIVFHEGDPGDSLHLVRQGMFAIRSSTPSGAILIVDILAPGDVFGEFAVFSNQRRRTTEVTALSPGATLTVEREQLRAAIGFRPELAEELIATIIGKAESTTQGWSRCSTCRRNSGYSGLCCRWQPWKTPHPRSG